MCEVKANQSGKEHLRSATIHCSLTRPHPWPQPAPVSHCQCLNRCSISSMEKDVLFIFCIYDHLKHLT